MAPAASIVVLCATPDSANYYEDIPLGIATLAGLPGVSVDLGQLRLVPRLTSASEVAGAELGHHIIQPALAANPDVSVFAASGDDGAYYGLIYPSASPEVVSVGGTSLYLNGNNTYSSEIGWGSRHPSTAAAAGTARRSPSPPTSRTTASPATTASAPTPTSPPTPTRTPAWPSTTRSTYGSATPWVQIGGTSLATPLWAGMAAIADQGRVLAGGAPLGSTAMLTDLYNLANIAPGDFHDITTGNNGYPAGPGYDLVTGLGSPVANLLIPDLSAYGLASKSTIVTQPPPTRRHRAPSSASSPRPRTRSAIPDPNYTGTATLSLVSGPAGATFTPVTVPVSDGLAVFDGLSLSQLSDGHRLRLPGLDHAA